MDEKLQEMIRRVVKKAIWQEVEFSELVRKMAEEYETQSFQYQEKDIFLERKEEFYQKANKFCQKEEMKGFSSSFATSQQVRKSVELLWQCCQSMLSEQKRTHERREVEREQAARNLGLSPYTMQTHEAMLLQTISEYYSHEEKEIIIGEKRVKRREAKIMYEEAFVQKILDEC